MATFYQLSKEELFQQLKTTPSGLNNGTIAILQKEYGKNVFGKPNKKVDGPFCCRSLMML